VTWIRVIARAETTVSELAHHGEVSDNPLNVSLVNLAHQRATVDAAGWAEHPERRDLLRWCRCLLVHRIAPIGHRFDHSRDTIPAHEIIAPGFVDDFPIGRH